MKWWFMLVTDTLFIITTSVAVGLLTGRVSITFAYTFAAGVFLYWWRGKHL